MEQPACVITGANGNILDINIIMNDYYTASVLLYVCMPMINNRSIGLIAQLFLLCVIKSRTCRLLYANSNAFAYLKEINKSDNEHVKLRWHNFVTINY